MASKLNIKSLFFLSLLIAIISLRVYTLAQSGFFTFILHQFITIPLTYNPGELMKVSSPKNSPHHDKRILLAAEEAAILNQATSLK
jgi:hypothetical protein